MKFLGFYLGRHDTNVTMTDGQTVRYFKAERIFGIKHEFRSINWVKKLCKDFKPDAVAYSDGDRNGLGQCKAKQLFKKTKSLFGVPTYCLDHYYAHVLSAWPVVSTDKVSVAIGIDGKGDHRMSRRTMCYPNKTIEHRDGKSIGRFFAKVGTRMGLKVGTLSNGIKLNMDFAGKVMGAQAYGKPKKQFDPVKALNRPYDMLDSMPKPKFKNQKFLNWLASTHKAMLDGIIIHFKTHCKPEDVIVYSGGVAQNTVFNDKLFEKYPNLHIPPHCYDGGMSLGCVEFLRMRYEQPEFNREGFPFWQQDEMKEAPDKKTVKRVAELLADNKIVGWFQGRGEVGPRALGNRSILMNPAAKDGKDILNKKVKHREHWRPFSPSVLWPDAKDWFSIDKPSPYMLRTVPVIKLGIPAVTHVDGSSRVQTVKSGLYADLIDEFKKLTGVPMVLNTSLNDGGEPLHATPEQSLRLFKKSEMDALCIGNKLYEK